VPGVYSLVCSSWKRKYGKKCRLFIIICMRNNITTWSYFHFTEEWEKKFVHLSTPKKSNKVSLFKKDKDALHLPVHIADDVAKIDEMLLKDQENYKNVFVSKIENWRFLQI